jgi:2,3,4,5-tetrahydropyridine-2-carboxylate N-succinyltransferase
MSADHSALASVIESAYEKRAEITPGNAPTEVREAVESAVRMLDAGNVRVAEKRDSAWTVNQWLKKAVLLSFRIAPNVPVEAQALKFYDKVPLKFSGWSEAQFASSGVRVVPPATVRRGAFVAPGVVLMPSYVNIGAYVDAGTMVDTWATVGSCAQIGKNVHLSGGVGIGGCSSRCRRIRPSSRTIASSAPAPRSSRV